MRTYPGVRPGLFQDPDERAQIKIIDDMLRQVSGALSKAVFPGQQPPANPNPSSTSSSPGGTQAVPQPLQGDTLYGIGTGTWAKLGIGASGRVYTSDGSKPQWATAGSVLAAAWPVGSIFVETTGTNPASTLLFGTWVAFGQGQVLVGYKSGDPDFGTGGGTGGAKTVTVASHADHTHTVTGTTTIEDLFGSAVQVGAGATDAAHASHHHDFSATTSGTSATLTHTAASIIQPYITVYFWNRTA